MCKTMFCSFFNEVQFRWNLKSLFEYEHAYLYAAVLYVLCTHAETIRRHECVLGPRRRFVMEHKKK